MNLYAISQTRDENAIGYTYAIAPDLETAKRYIEQQAIKWGGKVIAWETQRIGPCSHDEIGWLARIEDANPIDMLRFAHVYPIPVVSA